MKPVLVTGFEPYGGMAGNPALDAMRALDGTTIQGRAVVGRALPVSLARLGSALADTFDSTDPAAVICLGLAPGEPVIRIERVGLNLADFALADNDGTVSADRPVSIQGAAARFATLPVRRIERALLAHGIPARLSETAGTYLCNACLYSCLELLERRGTPVPCGFIHVPMTPALAAQWMMERAVSAVDRASPPSMSRELIVTATRIAIAETLAEIDEAQSPCSAGEVLVSPAAREC